MPHDSSQIARACQILATAARWLTVTVVAVAFAGCGDAGLGDACGETSPHVITNCEEGLYCDYDGYGGGTGVCKAQSKEGDLCLGPSAAPPCGSGLACSAATSPPTCVRSAAQGDPCAHDADCPTGLTCDPLTLVCAPA